MRARTWAGAVVTVGFVVVVVLQATAANQCPVRGQGACAQVHEMLMRPRTSGALLLVATPMRASAERG